MTKIRKVNVVLVSALLAAGVSAVTVQGCGSSSSGDYMALCTQSCEKSVTCFGIGDMATCKQQCSSQSTTMTCTNMAAIVSAYQNCLSMTCATYLDCIAGLPDCQGGSGMGGSSGSGTGGNSGNAGCSACTKAGACCVAVFTAGGQPTTSCSAYSAATCNAQSGTTQTQLIDACNQLVAAGAANNIAACR